MISRSFTVKSKLGSSEKYIKTMAEMVNSHFFIYNEDQRKIEYEIDVFNKRLLQPGNDFGNFTPVVRYLRDEDYLDPFVSKAKGASLGKILKPIMLMDIQIDYLIVASLVNSFEEDLNNFIEFQGYYLMSNSKLELHIIKGIMYGDITRELNISIPLN